MSENARVHARVRWCGFAGAAMQGAVSGDIPGGALRRRWSTGDVRPKDALAYWRDSVCEAILELGIDCPVGERFEGHLEQCALGAATLNFLEVTAQRVERTPFAVGRGAKRFFHLLHLRTGQCELEQGGRVTLLHAGDGVLLDSTAAHAVRCPVPTQSLIVQFSQEWLRGWIPQPERAVGQALRPQKGWTLALSAALGSLRPETLQTLSLPSGMVAEQLAALLALAIGRAPPPRSRRDELCVAIERTLKDRYHEVGLAPATVAAAHGISKRYLHFLFAARGATFGGTLLGVRLARARQLLADERFARVPIGEVAARCGFAEPSHFARCFRTRYGAAPGSYRAHLRGQASAITLWGARSEEGTRNLARRDDQPEGMAS